MVVNIPIEITSRVRELESALNASSYPFGKSHRCFNAFINGAEHAFNRPGIISTVIHVDYELFSFAGIEYAVCDQIKSGVESLKRIAGITNEKWIGRFRISDPQFGVNVADIIFHISAELININKILHDHYFHNKLCEVLNA